MLRAVADTHTVIWYIFGDSRLSAKARSTIEQIAADGDEVGFSSITLAEIVYLSEKSRIASSTLNRLLAEVDRQDALLIEIPFDRKIARTMPCIERSQIPVLPDRIIATTALYWEHFTFARRRLTPKGAATQTKPLRAAYYKIEMLPLYFDVPLISRDRKIQLSVVNTIW